MKKLYFLSMAVSLLLCSCNSKSTDDAAQGDTSLGDASGELKETTLPVDITEFSGVTDSNLEIAVNEAKITFVEVVSGETPLYKIETVLPLVISEQMPLATFDNNMGVNLMGENKDGFSIETLYADADDRQKIKQAIIDGLTDEEISVTFRSLGDLSASQINEMMQKVKSLDARYLDGYLKGSKLGSGKFYVENPNFSGAFADVIEINPDKTYKLKIGEPFIDDKDGKETVSVEMDIDVKILKNSSKNLEYCFIEFLDDNNKVVRKIDASYGLSDLNEKIHNGEVGSSKTISIGVFMSPSDAEKLDEAIAIRGGKTE